LKALPLKSIDTGARALAQRIASPSLTRVMRGFSAVGEAPALAALVILAVVWFWMLGRKRDAGLLAITMAGAGLLDEALKLLFHRPRPEPLFGTPLPVSYSFPSGHALASCCFFGVLAALLVVRERRRGVRVVLWVAAGLLVAMIGCSRIYLGVHYATDVIAGYAAALVWLFVMRVVYKMDRSDQARHL